MAEDSIHWPSSNATRANPATADSDNTAVRRCLVAGSIARIPTPAAAGATAGVSYAEAGHDAVAPSSCSARASAGADLSGFPSEVEIDELRRAALTDGDCNDPAQQDHRPDDLRPDAARPGLHAAVV